MKKNKIIKIGVVFVVFLLLVVVYLLLKGHNQEAEKQADETSENVIIDIKAEDIKDLSFTIKNEQMRFIKDQDNWTLDQDDDFPVDSEQMTVLTDALSNVSASRTLENVDDLGEYGLLEPSNKITITQTSGDSTSITIGNTNSVTGDCYIYLNNDIKVIYTIDSDLATVFNGSLMNYAVETSYPTITGSNITDIKIESGERIDYFANDDSSSAGWMITEADGQMKEADSEAVAALQSTIAGLTFSNYYEYNCRDLSKYGLDNPYAVITATYSEQSQTEEDTAGTETEENADNLESDDNGENTESIESNQGIESIEETTMVEKEVKIVVGNEDGNGNRYVQVNDSKEVHGIAVDSINSLIDTDESSYENKESGTIDTYAVESLDIVMNNETHTFLIESSDDENQETKYFLDDQEIEASQYSEIYAKISSMGNQGEVAEQKDVVGNPDITIIYHLKGGTVKEVSYIAYDNNFYVEVTPENETQYLVNKMKVKELIETAQATFPEIFKVSE